MRADKNDSILRKFFSWRTIISILFSITLVFGASGIGPNNFPSRQQEAYAQEFDEFGNPLNVTDFSTGSINGTGERTFVDEFGNPINSTSSDFSNIPIEAVNGTIGQQPPLVDEFGNPLNITDFPADSVNGTGEQQQLDRGVLQGLARQFGSIQNQPGDDSSSFPSGNDTTTEQPFVDEFGNGTGFPPSGNITDGQQQQGFVDEFGNVVQSDNVTAGNITNGQQPILDEFGNVVTPGSGVPADSPVPGQQEQSFTSVPGQQQSFVPGQQGQSFLPAGEVCDPNAETLEFMSTGPLVVRAQNLLIERGFNPGVVDGIYGANTVAAVEQFQRENGLIVDGKTGPQTWDALCRTPPIVQQIPPVPPTSTTTPPTTTLEQCDPNAETIRFLSEGPLVTRLQNLLIERGFNPGVVDGIFGQNTLSAVQQFQGANGLTVDGIVGPQTWNALCNTPPIILPQPPTTFPPTEVPPGTQPSFEEICGDFLDNDFNGQIDENCPTSPPIEPIQVCDTNTETNGEGDNAFSLTGVETPECLIVEPDPPCNASNTPDIPENLFLTYNKGPAWTFKFGIIDEEGLVLHKILAKSEHVLDRLSVTHFKVDLPIPSTTQPTEVIVRFCEATDPHSKLSPPATIDPIKGIDLINWQFEKSITDSKNQVELGRLLVNYEYIIRFEKVGINCEFGGAPCFRIVPKVTYTWNSNLGVTPNNVEAFYRLDLGKQTFSGRGIVPFGKSPASIGFAPFQESEKVFSAVQRINAFNSTKGDIDNFHDVHSSEGVHVPGCRPTEFNCFHMHWRWNGATGIGEPLIDVLVDPSNDNRFRPGLAGQPYLVPGQEIDIGLVKFKATEQKYLDKINSPFDRPNADPLTLASPPEIIAVGSKVVEGGSTRFSTTKLDIGDHLLIYYVASSLKEKDTFFRHGIYVLDTTKAKVPFTGTPIPNCGLIPTAKGPLSETCP